MNKRKHKRVRKKLMVSLKESDFETLGLSHDISKSGLSVSSDHMVPPQTEIELAIAVPGEVFTLKGEVIWCKENGSDINVDIPDNIGIKIVEAPAEYLNYVEYLKHMNITPGIPEF